MICLPIETADGPRDFAQPVEYELQKPKITPKAVDHSGSWPLEREFCQWFLYEEGSPAEIDKDVAKADFPGKSQVSSWLHVQAPNLFVILILRNVHAHATLASIIPVC